jgi:uncharacterized membrane protein YeiH
MLGAACMVAGHSIGWDPIWTAVGGAAACIALRLLSIRHGWQLPVAPPPRGS